MHELEFKIRRGPNAKVTDEQAKEFIRRYKTGESAVSIGRDFGVNYHTVLNHMRRIGKEQG